MFASLWRASKSRLLWALGLLVVVFGGAAAWYFGHYTKTPGYAIRAIQESVAKHDQQQFARYFDLDKIASDSGGALLDGMLDADASLTETSRQTVATFAQMFKAPLDASFKAIINDYVQTGDWGGKPEQQGNLSIDSDIILNQAGLKAVQWRSLDGVEVDSEQQTATVSVRVYQSEIGEEFVLKALMAPDESGRWRVNGLDNLREFVHFIAEKRKVQLQAYMTATAEMVARYETAIKDYDAKMKSIMHGGELSKDATRQQLKQIVERDVIPKWQQRQEELKAVNVPASAMTLHHLRLRICDLQLQYWRSYAEWLDTKTAAAARRANERMKDIRTLEREAEILTRQISGKS